MIFSHRTKAGVLSLLFVLVLISTTDAQRKEPTAKPVATPAIKVTQVDDVGVKKILAPKNKPLLVNFWATWCDPCREEFPELVELDHEYKGKIDFITISLDDVEDIRTTVPKFLGEMKAEMPAYLLRTTNESAVIESISKDWRGGMPFTALFDTKGNLVYFREGKVVLETMRSELNKVLSSAPAAGQ